MDFRDNYEYDEMDSRYAGNRNMYCDLCMRRCRGIYHVIESGDTLYSLGKRYHVSVSDLMRANPYVNVYNLRIGEELCIPVRPQPGMGGTMPPVQQPRMDGDGMTRMPRMSDDLTQQPRMKDSRKESEVQEEHAPQRENVEMEEMSAPKMTENQFSETDTIQEVLEKAGLTMSDFVRFLAEKTD